MEKGGGVAALAEARGLPTAHLNSHNDAADFRPQVGGLRVGGLGGEAEAVNNGLCVSGSSTSSTSSN